jgi:hypothetical protein
MVRSTTAILELVLLTVAAIFLGLHALHLKADFPNHSPWMDWAKYTDEGWYGDAAIRHFQRGDWYVPGDFNPAAALPVWPLVESVVFHFTGANVIAARSLAVAIFALILASTYFLVRRGQQLRWPGRGRSLAPAAAVLLLAVSPFCYAFSRMAILEPMLILLTLLTLLCASYVREPGGESLGRLGWLRQNLPAFAVGILLPLMVLTKTTAVFLFPAVAWVLFARSGYRVRTALKAAWPAALLAIFLWVSYYSIVVRPHFLGDYRYLFTANDYTGVTSQNLFQVLQEGFADGMWIGQMMYPLAVAAAIVALLIRPRLLKNPLLPALLLWIAGYLAFIIYHDNLQPRYYLVIVVPMTVVAVVVFEEILRPREWGKGPTLSAALISTAALTILTVADARQTLDYVRHPEYTFATAAEQVRRIVDSDPSHKSLVLSISGSDLSLMTGLPSICDDFGTMELSDRVKAYQPGWYVAWNQVDDDKMDALTSLYRLKRVASFPAMDDPERNLLILYRLDPIPADTRRHRRTFHPATGLLQADFSHPEASAKPDH